MDFFKSACDGSNREFSREKGVSEIEGRAFGSDIQSIRDGSYSPGPEILNH